MTLETILTDSNPTVLTSGQIRIRCPFRELHEDGSGKASMFLTPHLNLFHCFSCRSKGRLTNLLTTRFEVPFYEALTMVHVEEYTREKKESLRNVDYYWDLKPHQDFLDRGFTPEILNRFKVGTDDDIAVIPMYWDGELKGIKYRRSKPDRDFWYSKGFNKEEYIYNGDARYKDYVVLVEGETDVWRNLMRRYNTYGLLGTAMSDWQAAHIANTKRVYIASDCDEAGIKAANSWYQKLHKHTDVLFINYPAEDPDKCSFREWKFAFDNPCNIAEFKYLTEQEE